MAVGHSLLEPVAPVQQVPRIEQSAEVRVAYDRDVVPGVFGVSVIGAKVVNVNNNLACHFVGRPQNHPALSGFSDSDGGYDTSDHHFYNNTVDWLDTTGADPNYLRGIFMWSVSADAPGTYCSNTIITNFMGDDITGYSCYVAHPHPLSYSTGYNLGSLTDYFSGWTMLDGNVDYPGINPLYVNNTSLPYDYRFQPGSGCEMGDPNFIDWDDTGSPSGDPDEPNIQNRSRMGCFGGPDGDWDPNNL